MEDLFDWWKRKAKTLTFSKVWLYGVALIPYFVWMERNARCHNSAAKQYKQCFAMVKGEICMFSSVHLGHPLSISDLLCARRLGIPRVVCKHREIIEVFWCPPFPGWVKLNIDGCSFGNPGKAGVRGIFRNERTKSILNFRKFVDIKTNFEAKFLAIMAGLEQAKDHGFQNLWIECDSATVVILQSKSLIPWFIQQRWRGILPFMNSINWKVSHCFREANTVADFLAKSATRLEISSLVAAWARSVFMDMDMDAAQHPRYRFP
ncbi:uncharacterized protein LOC122092877 [Macadamia integrifolia]|uniref:uncharacterized protein LOC122092877 n=1 Tax=Macadamia integrifolia TaxID=60698 RepID=UPI001C533F7C|nr:uncharacterized protein LOC122092877 [Macadamia integrifolia]